MKREDVSRIFEGATDDQISAILDINSRDIGSAKSKGDQLTEQITALNAQITQRDSDMTALREKLTAAQADAGKLTEAQSALADLQAKYAADSQAWESQRKAQAYEFAVRTKAGELKFSSNAARNDFIRSAVGKQMQLDGDQILGFDDFAKAYREADPSAFLPDAPQKPAPTISLPGTHSPQPAGAEPSSLREALSRKYNTQKG